MISPTGWSPAQPCKNMNRKKHRFFIMHKWSKHMWNSCLDVPPTISSAVLRRSYVILRRNTHTLWWGKLAIELNGTKHLSYATLGMRRSSFLLHLTAAEGTAKCKLKNLDIGSSALEVIDKRMSFHCSIWIKYDLILHNFLVKSVFVAHVHRWSLQCVFI